MKEIKNLTVIYHSKDLDGITSGALLKQAYPDAKLQGYDHNEPIDFEISENVIFADICFKPEQMLELRKKSNIIVIDHHISAHDKYYEMVEKIGHDFYEDYVYDKSYSACMGVFKWLYPEKEIPEALKLLSDFDIRKLSPYWESETLPFQFAMRSICNSVETFPLEVFDSEICDSYVEQLIPDGETIIKFQETQDKLACDKNSFIIEFEGHRAICLNVFGGNFDTFKSIYDYKKHEMVMTFYYDNSRWHISMYTDKYIDCSLIARKYGGGGHKQAAGFEISDINELLKLKI